MTQFLLLVPIYNLVQR